MASKYRVLAQLLREELAAHSEAPNYRLPTERELSERYQMSRQTVRHALELLTQEGLIQKRQGSGAYATGGSHPGSMEVAVITTFVDEYIFPRLLHDMEAVLHRQGYGLRVYITMNRISTERDILNSLISHPVGGILVEGSKTALPSPNTDLYEKLRRMHIPIVFFQGRYQGLSHFPAVTDDNVAGGCALADYLIQKGHRVIGGIFKSDDIQGIERYSGVVNAIRDAGLPLPDQQICWYDTDERRQLVEGKNPGLLAQFLDHRLLNTTAVICYNDEIAYHLIQVLLSRGKRIPQDMAVVSFDNSYYSQISPVPITSLWHRTSRMGTEAARQLLNLLEGRPGKSQALPWELQMRDSG